MSRNAREEAVQEKETWAMDSSPMLLTSSSVVPYSPEEVHDTGAPAKDNDFDMGFYLDIRKAAEAEMKEGQKLVQISQDQSKELQALEVSQAEELKKFEETQQNSLQSFEGKQTKRRKELIKRHKSIISHQKEVLKLATKQREDFVQLQNSEWEHTSNSILYGRRRPQGPLPGSSQQN